VSEAKHPEEDDEKFLIPYLKNIENLKSVHPEIQVQIDNYVIRLRQLIIPKKIILVNHRTQKDRIEKAQEDKELMDIYSNIDLISIHLPNYIEVNKGYNTILNQENQILSTMIVELVNIANGIKNKKEVQ
jgi:hypothetical protein